MTLQMSKDHDSLSTVIKPCEFPLFDDVDYLMYPDPQSLTLAQAKKRSHLSVTRKHSKYLTVVMPEYSLHFKYIRKTQKAKNIHEI